jgi:hypothetical protein
MGLCLLAASAAPPVAHGADAAATTSIICASTPASVLRVHVVNEAGAASIAMDAARVEASEIWARAGLTLAWTARPQPVPPADGRSVIVIIRSMMTRPPRPNEATSSGRMRTPLGSLTFDVNDQPGNLIQVSLQSVLKLVRRGKVMNGSLTAQPTFVQEHILGRGLGRVIAHEIGHWVLGRGHMRTGLMKPKYGVQDLTAPLPPEFPRSLATRNQDVAIGCRRIVEGRTVSVAVGSSPSVRRDRLARAFGLRSSVSGLRSPVSVSSLQSSTEP